MDGLSPAAVAALLAGGLFAGVVNTLAGGGSLLTVPLLVLLGVPGGVANGTNRIGVLLQSLVATWRFRSSGRLELRDLLPVLAPVLAGSLVGATAITRVDDATFERLFGALMLLLLVPTLRRTRAAAPGPGFGRVGAWLVFFGLGLYGGALQAGVGIPLVFALVYAGHDLVRANAIKVAAIASVTATAIPVFAIERQIAWPPALVLGAGFAVGAELGVRLAVAGGERVIRPVLVAAVLALAGRMLDLY
jgi:uncharacterized membrane protein YfcA